jgi:membrane-associated protease RseP (regulator of RpoE activity)
MQTLCFATLCLLLAAGGPAGAAEPVESEPLITLDLSGIDLEAAVEVLSAQSGRRFLLTESAQATALGPNITLSGVPLSMAIKTVSTIYGVCSVVRPGIISFEGCTDDNAVNVGNVQLGVALVRMTPESVYEAGGIVTHVLPDSVASRAGIQREDRIISFDGRPISRASELIDAVSKVEPGAVVTIGVLRNGRRSRLTARF